MSGYKNIITAKMEIDRWHDDYFGKDEGVEVLKFPYMNMFGDFRFLNGLSMQYVDYVVGRLREIMIEVANQHAINGDKW